MNDKKSQADIDSIIESSRSIGIVSLIASIIGLSLTGLLVFQPSQFYPIIFELPLNIIAAITLGLIGLRRSKKINQSNNLALYGVLISLADMIIFAGFLIHMSSLITPFPG